MCGRLRSGATKNGTPSSTGEATRSDRMPGLNDLEGVMLMQRLIVF